MGEIIDQLRQDVRGEIPKTGNLLERAIQASRPNDVPLNIMGGFVPSTGQEAKDIPRAFSGSLNDLSFGFIPQMTESPETGFGENLQTGITTGVGASVLGGLGQGIDKLIRFKEISKVNKIQKAFGPWVKGYTNKYGKSLRGGIKGILRDKGGSQESLKKVRKAFNPLRRSDSYKDLPSKTRDSIEKVYADKVKPRDVLNAANRLRKSPQASKFDEAGGLVRETGKKLKNIVREKSPGFSKVDREYGEFSGVRDVMQKFKPGAMSQGKFGTQQGTRILRDIGKRQPGDLEAMNRFGEETGINIVGPAKIASAVRGTTKAVGTVAKLGGALWLLRKLFPQQSSQVAQAIDITR